MQIIRQTDFPKLGTFKKIERPKEPRYDYSPWAALNIGGVTREDLIKRLRRQYTIASWGEPNRLERLEFDTLPEQKEILLGVFTTEDLELPDNCKLADVHNEAYLAEWSKRHLKEFGLTAKLCPSEVGPHLRLQYAQPPNECLVLAMSLLKGYMWSVETFGKNLPPRFDISPIEADHSWNRYNFVFMLE